MNKKFLITIIVITLLLGVGTIYLYLQFKNQPEVPLGTGADMIKEEEMIRVLFPKGGETLEIGSRNCYAQALECQESSAKLS